MIIRKKWIRNLRLNLPLLEDDSNIVVGIANPDRFEHKIIRMGFRDGLNVDTTVLPLASLGPVCKFNAEGKYHKHKDRPMETP